MRAPSYQSQTSAPEGSKVRLVAADNGGGVAGGIARGLQSAAKGIGQYAEAELQIQETHNAIQARQLRLQMMQELQPLVSQYQTLKGLGAGEQAKAMREQIAKARETYAGRAGNDRQKMLFEQITEDDVFRMDSAVVDHSIKELWQSEWDTNTAELAQVQTAIAQAPLDAGALDENLSLISAIAGDLSRMAGDSPEMAEDRLRSANTVAISTAIDGMLKDPNANVDQIIGFYESNRDLLTAKGILDIEGVLAEPRLNRALDDELDSYVSGVSSSAADAGVGGGVSSSAAPGTAPRQTPATGPVTDNFDEHRSRGSAGLDIAAPRGSAVKPVADGVVEEAGTGKTGGNFIRIRHADGTLTSYMHMGQPPAYKKGDRVTQSTIIGTVGSTGRASGPHLHLEVKDAQGRQIDPEEYLKGATPIGAASEPRVWNTAAVLESINRDEDAGKLTPERADQLRGRFARRVKRDQDVIDQRDSDAVRAAQEWMLVPGNLDNFTRYEQLPANVRAGFKPDTALRFVEVARQGAAGQAADNAKLLKDQQDFEYAKLTGMKAIEEDTFMSIDLTQYAGRVSTDQFISLATAQADMKQKREAGELTFDPGPKIKSTITAMAAGDGEPLKEGDPKFGAIATIVRDRYNAFVKDNKGKLPSDLDYAEFYRYATAKVPVKYSRGIDNLFMGSTGEQPRFQIEGAVERAATRNQDAEAARTQRRQTNLRVQQIRAAFVRKHGRYPTPAELAQLGGEGQ